MVYTRVRLILFIGHGLMTYPQVIKHRKSISLDPIQLSIETRIMFSGFNDPPNIYTGGYFYASGYQIRIARIGFMWNHGIVHYDTAIK